MLVHLWFLTFAVVGVQRGLSLKCYSCLSTEPRDACVKLDKNKIPLKSCDIKELAETERYAKEVDEDMGKLYEVHAAQEPLIPLNCLKQEIQHGNKHYVLRGCQLATGDNLDICIKVKKEKNDNDNLRTKYCSLCNGDGCNVAIQKDPLSFLGTIGVTLVTFLMYYQM